MKYCMKNWCEYIQPLANRGVLKIWIDEATMSSWINTKKIDKKGTSKKYSDETIQCCIALKTSFVCLCEQLKANYFQFS